MGDVDKAPAFQGKRATLDQLLNMYRPGWETGPGSIQDRRYQAIEGALSAQRVMHQAVSAVQMQNGVLRQALSMLKAAGVEFAYGEKIAAQLNDEFKTIPSGKLTND